MFFPIIHLSYPISSICCVFFLLKYPQIYLLLSKLTAIFHLMSTFLPADKYNCLLTFFLKSTFALFQFILCMTTGEPGINAYLVILILSETTSVTSCYWIKVGILWHDLYNFPPLPLLLPNTLFMSFCKLKFCAVCSFILS